MALHITSFRDLEKCVMTMCTEKRPNKTIHLDRLLHVPSISSATLLWATKVMIPASMLFLTEHFKIPRSKCLVEITWSICNAVLTFFIIVSQGKLKLSNIFRLYPVRPWRRINQLYNKISSLLVEKYYQMQHECSQHKVRFYLQLNNKC